MGSEARVVMYVEDEARAAAAADAAFSRMAVLEQSLSDWRIDSEVMRLRSADPGAWTEISPALSRALDQALLVHRWTEGAFDPTCGRMTAKWREARAAGGAPPVSPVSAAITAGRLTGVERMSRSGTAIRFESPVPWLDFGGIGKGLAADAALESMRAAGIEAALAELGGDMALGAAPPGKVGWPIRVGDDARAAQLVLTNCGVATSGSGQQHLINDGAFSSHIIDPRTGLWVGKHPDVTVVASSAGEADAIASAACVLGPDELRRLLRLNRSTSQGSDPRMQPIVIGLP